MERIYHKYEVWEDYKNGMYNDSDVLDKDKLVFESIKLLSSPDRFYNVMDKILKEWVNSCDENLSNKSINRRAWLGAAACSFNHKCPEYLTRIAWSLMNPDKQAQANNLATLIIEKYERKNKGLHKTMGNELLF